MTKPKRIGVLLAGVVTITILLALSVNFILTRTIVLETLKEKLIEKLCQASGCQVEFERLEFFLLPAPHVAFSGLRIDSPGMLTGTAESLALAPRILPLFLGRLEPAAVRLIAPRLEILIADHTETHPAEEARPANNDSSSKESQPLTEGSSPNSQPSELSLQLLSLSHLEARLFSVLTDLVEQAPGLRLHIERGNFVVVQKTRRLISLNELAAQVSLPPQTLTIRIECHSEFWGKLALEAWFDPVESKYSGRLSLNQLRAQLLGDHLSANALKPAGESPIDFDASFSGDGSGLFRTTFQSLSPSLTIQLGDHRAVIRNAALEGTLQTTAGKLDLQVSRLAAEDPQLSLSGRFSSDPEAHDIGYRVEGKDINAASVRDAALALAGEIPVIQDIFEIVRSGQVPLVTFETRGRSMADLQRSKNLLVQGSLRNGRVFIPKVKLDVGDVNGDVVISQGILEGKNLQGTTEGSIGCNGSLTVALAKKDGPFHLDIEIDADLAQLPPVLARVVDNKAFLRELALVQDVTGRATGRLILGETLNEIKTRVEVKDMKFKGRYQRFPFPLKLKAKTFLYDGSEIAVGTLQGSFGKSEVLDLSGSLNWSQEPELELASPTKGRIFLDELFPWLMTFPSVSNNRWNIQALEGTFLVDSLSFKGPLARPEDWRFSLTSRIEEVTSHAGALEYPLQVKSGSVSATHQALEVENADLAFLDASLSASGKLNGYMASQPAADFTFRGTLGEQANEWISNLTGLSTELRMRTPLSTPGSLLRWEKDGRTSLSGVFQANGGAALSLDLEHTGQDLLLKQLQVEDHESNATITADIKAGELGFSFNGNLAGRTLDRLLATNRLFRGTMTGSLTAQVFQNRLADSKVDGHLSLSGFGYAPVPEQSLRIEDASLEAKGNTLAIKKAAILLQDELLELKGTVRAGQDQVRLDLDLSAEEIAWNRLQAVLSPENWETGNRKRTAARGTSVGEIPVRGNLRIHANRFNYGNYIWKPLEASLMFTQDGINVEVTQADLCTIPTPTKVIQHPQGTLLMIHLNAHNLDLDSTLSCLWDRKGVITGSFDLTGEITANVQQQRMSETFRGNLILNARNGRVYHSTVLAKTFDLLNVTEIYRGQLPDLMNEGCAYDSITARAALKNGKLMVKDAVFDGRCAKMVWTGEIDLESQKVKFTVLVSPLKTVDRVIRHIPLVGRMLGDSLVSIPIQVTGDLSDPNVTPFSPSAVDSSLLGTMKKAFRFPFKLIQPLQ